MSTQNVELRERIEHDFRLHAPANEDIGKRHDRARTICRDAALNLIDILPDGREKALVVTKLQEAMMWSDAAIALNQ